METAPKQTSETNESTLEPEPNWEDVSERLDILNVPNDPESRAKDVAANLAGSGKDIYYLSMAIHQVLVPGVESKPTDYPMKVSSPDGSKSTEMALPEERMAIFDYASELIQQLDKQNKGEHNQEFLERASNIMALSIVLAHSYQNGNGRTARLIGGLVRDGRLGSDEDLKVLGKGRPETGFRITSYVPRNENLKPEQILETAASLDIPLSDNQTYVLKSSEAFASPYN